MPSSSRTLAVVDADTKKRTAKKAAKTTRKKSIAKKATQKTTKRVAAAKSVKAVTTKSVVKKGASNKTVSTSTTKVIKTAPAKATGPKVDKTATLDTKKSFASLKREPLGHLLIEQKLRAAGFKGGISTSEEYLKRYSYDESIFSVKPQIVIQPHNQKDVETAVKVIAVNTAEFPSLSLTPRAAGTGLSGGSLTDSVVIDMCAHMHELISVDERRSGTTFTCEPGLMWRDLEKALKKKDVYLPSFPASKDICSVGGAVANNSAGPDSLRFGHCADWVESLDVTLHDGVTYTFKALTLKEFKALIKKDNAHGQIAKAVFELIKKHESTVDHAEPKTKKNSAGYPLWDVINGSVADFEKGKATFNLCHLIAGSQGTIGVITKMTMRTEPIKNDTVLVTIPIFSLEDAGKTIIKALEYDPINVELFDGLTFDLALKNPSFFKDRLSGAQYYKVLLAMYTLYHVRYMRKTPEFTLLVTLDTSQVTDPAAAVTAIKKATGTKARLVTNTTEHEMFWQIRRASYTLSKFQDKHKRPAAFLEDMTVPPKHLPKFFTDIKRLLKKYNVTAAVHGHGGNGHLHFYPLLDFTSKTTPDLVEKMAEEFFATAVKYDGNICGEHNDGIIRTPHLSKMFNKATLELFKKLEHTFDPDDIFNPGKKVNPRFDIKDSLRKVN